MDLIKVRSTTKKINNKGVAEKPVNRNTVQKKNSVLHAAVKHATVKEFAVLKNMSGYTNEDLAALVGITHRTIRNKKTSNKIFNIAQTERLRKLSVLFIEGSEIFGDKNQFNTWLQKPSYGLDYDMPAELLKQPGGLDKVMNELNSIKFGDTV